MFKFLFDLLICKLLLHNSPLCLFFSRYFYVPHHTRAMIIVNNLKFKKKL
jgi:hypothetical protein